MIRHNVFLGFVLVVVCGTVCWAQVTPLDYQAIVTRLSYLNPAALENLIATNRVNFELTQDQEKELAQKGATPGILSLIKEHRQPGILRLRCKPVDCDISINGAPAGRTSNRVLPNKEMAPGKVVVTAKAAGHIDAPPQFLTLEVGKPLDYEFTLEPVRVEAAPPPPPPPATTGIVELTCRSGVGECEVQLDNRATELTRQKMRSYELPPGPHVFKIRTERFLEGTETIDLKAGDKAKLSVSLTADPNFDQGLVFEKILGALGGRSALEKMLNRQAKAEGKINNGGRTIHSATLIESVKPIGFRWDLKVLTPKDTKWSVRKTEDVWKTDEDKVVSEALANNMGDALNTFSAASFAELFFSLSDGGKYEREITKANEMQAKGGLGTFKITYNEKYLPTRIDYEPRTAGLIRGFVTYDRWSKPVDGMTFPFIATVGLPAHPSFSFVIEYNSYWTNPKMEDKDISKREFGFEDKPKFEKEKTKCFVFSGDLCDPEMKDFEKWESQQRD